MPNHVTNQVWFSGNPESIARLQAFVCTEDNPFDFEKIVPMPETYHKYDTTNHPDARGLEVGKHVNQWDDNTPIVTEELIEEYKRATAEQRDKYGVVGWYNWHCRYWGTKWNSYDHDSDNGYTFNTAWSAPLPVLERLSQLFPDADVHFIYADENMGYNTGAGCFRNGELEIYRPEGGSNDAMELYFQTHDWARDMCHKNEDGEWVWDECED